MVIIIIIIIIIIIKNPMGSGELYEKLDRTNKAESMTNFIILFFSHSIY